MSKMLKEDAIILFKPCKNINQRMRYYFNLKLNYYVNIYKRITNVSKRFTYRKTIRILHCKC